MSDKKTYPAPTEPGEYRCLVEVFGIDTWMIVSVTDATLGGLNVWCFGNSEPLFHYDPDDKFVKDDHTWGPRVEEWKP